MTKYRIGVYPGDGIGVDVTAEAVRVLQRVAELDGTFSFDLLDLPWGCKYYEANGIVAPDDFLEILRPLDAILLGAVGWPAKLPDHVTLSPLVRIRQAFDQYVCLRPARLLPGLGCILSGKSAKDIDILVLRENSEGEYVDQGGFFKRHSADEFALQTALHTRRGIERVLRYGFRLAQQRRRRLTMITKSNAQRYSFVLWDEALDRIAPEFPDVENDRQHADAAVMNFVRRPETFDVVVASNLFGDILTDLGGLLAGGLGLAPSSNINPERRFPSLFEPVHGSAPDIAGQGIANPCAAILSAAMMLDHLGERSSAERIRGAVERAILGGARTPDLGGAQTTEQVGAAVARALES